MLVALSSPSVADLPRQLSSLCFQHVTDCTSGQSVALRARGAFKGRATQLPLQQEAEATVTQRRPCDQDTVCSHRGWGCSSPLVPLLALLEWARGFGVLNT